MKVLGAILVAVVVIAVVAVFAFVSASDDSDGPAAAAPSAWADVSTFGTKDRAFRLARGCLLDSGARSVGRRRDGGGYVLFPGARPASWRYKTFRGRAADFHLHARGRLHLSARREAVLEGCVARGLRG
jgi:hypothetical protein